MARAIRDHDQTQHHVMQRQSYIDNLSTTMQGSLINLPSLSLSVTMRVFSSTSTVLFLLLGLAKGVHADLQAVFAIDESGSMGDVIQDMKANVNYIFNELPSGARVGLVGYGHDTHAGGYDDPPHVHSPLTGDRTAFQIATDQMEASPGVLEQGYRVVYEVATNTVADGVSLDFDARNEGFCMVIITDESLDQGGKTREEATTAMQANNGIFFGIMPSYLHGEAQPLADATGGQMFDITSFLANPQTVLDTVLTSCIEATDTPSGPSVCDDVVVSQPVTRRSCLRAVRQCCSCGLFFRGQKCFHAVLKDKCGVDRVEDFETFRSFKRQYRRWCRNQ